MPLSNSQILEYKELGSIVILPFNQEQLCNVSYDLTLGAQIARHTRYDNFAIEEAVYNHTDDRNGFWIDPMETVLAHSREIAGGREWPNRFPAATGVKILFRHHSVTTTLHTTSTAARNLWQAHSSAGYGDVGFISPWVFEVTNLAKIRRFLPVGAVIAQVAFHTTGSLLPGTSYERRGSYQSSADPEEILKTWTLRDGLPKPLKVRS